MLKSGYRQKAGVLNNHLMILDHIEECTDQLVIRNGNDLVYILLDIREQLIARCAVPSAMVLTPGRLTTWPAFKDSCIQFAPSGSTPITWIFGLSIFASVDTPVHSPPPPIGQRM